MERKIKHLEMIQNGISRMANNSFLIRGWSVTLLSAIFALAASGTNRRYICICYFALPLFWALDGFYLHQERSYRALYDNVRLKSESEIDFSMNAREFNVGDSTWVGSLISHTLIIFYGGMLAIVILVMFWV